MPWSSAAGRRTDPPRPRRCSCSRSSCWASSASRSARRRSCARRPRPPPTPRRWPGAQEIQRQLEAQWATFGTTDMTAIDERAVVAKMARVRAPQRRRGSIPKQRREINGADVKAWVVTERQLGEDARAVDRADATATARARATLHARRADGRGRLRARRPAPAGRAAPRITRRGVGRAREEDRPSRRDCPGTSSRSACSSRPRLHGLAERGPAARRRRRARRQAVELAPQVRRQGRARRQLGPAGDRARPRPPVIDPLRRAAPRARLLHDLARGGPLRPPAHRRRRLSAPTARRRRVRRPARRRRARHQARRLGEAGPDAVIFAVVPGDRHATAARRT